MVRWEVRECRRRGVLLFSGSWDLDAVECVLSELPGVGKGFRASSDLDSLCSVTMFLEYIGVNLSMGVSRNKEPPATRLGQVIGSREGCLGHQFLGEGLNWPFRSLEVNKLAPRGLELLRNE